MNVIEQITELVRNHFELDKELFYSKLQKREYTQAKQLAMWFCRNKTTYSWAKIGLNICGKNHATVMHGVKNINNLIDTKEEIVINAIEKLTNQVEYIVKYTKNENIEDDKEMDDCVNYMIDRLINRKFEEFIYQEIHNSL